MCTVLYQPESVLTTCIHFCFASIHIFSCNELYILYRESVAVDNII